MAAPGLLSGVLGGGKVPEKKKKEISQFAFAAQGKGREGLLAGLAAAGEGQAKPLTVLGSHRWETRPGSSKIVRVKKKP